jgi:long-chain acyl-CoA synthetase
VPLHALLEDSAARFPDRVACTLYNHPTTYRDLADEARRLAGALRDLGAGPGKHVGILLPNIPEYLTTLQATWLTGASVLQLSPLFVAEEVRHWLELTGCHIVVTLDLLAQQVMPSLGKGPLEHVILTSLSSRLAYWKGFLYLVERYRRNGFLYQPSDAHRHRYDRVIQHAPLADLPGINPAEDVALVAPTGGTTASPKAVMQTHRNLVCNAMQLRAWCDGLDGTDGVLGVLPLFHSYGLAVGLLASWARAATLHLYPKFEVGPVLRIIQEQRPEMIPAVPAMLRALNIAMRGKPVDLSFVRTVLSGAAALPQDVRTEFQAHGATGLIEGYGLTEASPVTHANPLTGPIKPGTIGITIPDTEARLIDVETGRELEAGEVGELLVRGPQVMKGYFNNPTATAEVLRDGWLHTGDIARRDTDGYYTLVDRKRDIIKTSGFLVYPAEVEEVLKSFPGVADAAVVGEPDDEKGEVIRALVIPAPGKSLDLARLEAHCKEHLGKHKRPRKIEVVADLPRNFLGKVMRRKLRKMQPA